MALMGEKRGNADGLALLRPNKRPKRGKRLKNTINLDVADKEQGAGVPPEHLNWRKVSLPDRLEDGEGFFGLEEIEGVDVIRNEEFGDVEYRVRRLLIPVHLEASLTENKYALEKGRQKDNIRDNLASRGGRTGRVDAQNANIYGDDTWEGFHDDETALTGLDVWEDGTSHNDNRSKERKRNGSLKSERKDQSSKSPMKQPPASNGNAFAILDNDITQERADGKSFRCKDFGRQN